MATELALEELREQFYYTAYAMLRAYGTPYMYKCGTTVTSRPRLLDRRTTIYNLHA